MCLIHRRESVGGIDGIRAMPRVDMQLLQQKQTIASQRAWRGTRGTAMSV